MSFAPSLSWSDEFGSGSRPQRFDAFSGLRERWKREQKEAEQAKAFNELLQATATTRFRVGQVVLLAGLGGRRRVRIIEVFPVGYISVPSKYDNLGRWSKPVTCDQPLYRFRDERADNRAASGQTSEDRLSEVPKA
jgi:hypothetical protein